MHMEFKKDLTFSLNRDSRRLDMLTADGWKGLARRTYILNRIVSVSFTS